jgi:hypothetical protein
LDKRTATLPNQDTSSLPSRPNCSIGRRHLLDLQQTEVLEVDEMSAIDGAVWTLGKVTDVMV